VCTVSFYFLFLVKSFYFLLPWRRNMCIELSQAWEWSKVRGHRQAALDSAKDEIGSTIVAVLLIHVFHSWW
jgi:hypothetical protein